MGCPTRNGLPNHEWAAQLRMGCPTNYEWAAQLRMGCPTNYECAVQLRMGLPNYTNGAAQLHKWGCPTTKGLPNCAWSCLNAASGLYTAVQKMLRVDAYNLVGYIYFCSFYPQIKWQRSTQMFYKTNLNVLHSYNEGNIGFPCLTH